jgi:multiple sugar transport system substrate-binding protein
MRRRVAGVTTAVTAVLLSLATACSGSAAPDPFPQPSVDAARPLIVASGADLTTAPGTAGGSGGGIRRRLIAEWNRLNPRRPARLVELPRAADDQRSELVAALQSGTAAYDVVNLDITWIPEFADSGLIQRLDPGLVDGDFLQQAADTGRWKGHTYAVPFNTDVGLLYYRTGDLARARRSPKDLRRYANLSDLLQAVRSITPFAYTTQLRAYEGLTVNTLEAFWSVGVNLVDAHGRYIGTEDALRRGLDELNRINSPNSNSLDPESLEADESVSLARFRQGASILMRDWPYAYNQLDAGLAPSARFGVARLPGTAVLGGQSLAVTAAAGTRQRDAADLIRFLTGPDSQLALLQAGFAPARQSAYGTDDADCTARNPAAWYYDRPVRSGSESTGSASPPSASSSASSSASTSAGDRPGYTTLLWCALRQARARPATAHYVTFTRLLQREVHRMLVSHASGKDATVEDTAHYLDQHLARALGGR